MDEISLISALSLFAGASLLPASLLIFRDRDIPIDRRHHITGGMALLMACVLLGLGMIFVWNTIKQDMELFLILVGLLIVLPVGIIQLDKRLK